MALVKQSTWNQMTHSLNQYLSDFTSGVSDAFMDAVSPLNQSIDESLRDDILADETEEERLEREQQEELEKEQAKLEQQEEEEREAMEEEEQWQEEQDALLEEEASEPGTLSKMYDAFKESSFYAGYSGVRNLMVGGALIGAGLGITGSAGLAASAALPVASTAWDLMRAARDRLYGEQEVLKDEAGLMEAEAQASQGVPEDQRQETAEIGTTEYNNIKAKEKTRDQKLMETEEEITSNQVSGAGKEKVDPAYVEETVNELMAGIEKEPEEAFDFSRG